MASRLAPCPSCSRHVKVGPPSCPFCGAAVPTQVAARVLNLAPGRPLTRAALIFAGAAAVTACSSSSSGGGTTGTHDAAIDRGEPEPLYGVAVGPDGGEPEPAYGVAVGPDGGQGGVLYGVAVQPDAGVEDAAHDLDGQAVAAYGVMADPDGGVK